MNFSEWLLTENMTATQFLKHPKNALVVPSLKETVNAFLSGVLLPKPVLDRLANWMTKELIVQNVVSSAQESLNNMWTNVKDYVIAHAQDGVLLNKLNMYDYTYQNMIADSEDWHERMAMNAHGKPAEGRTIVDLNGVPGFQGWKWVALDKAVCDKEADAMGHCGNSSGEHPQNILSLRDPQGNAHLTFINKIGVLGEMKGRGNSKPSPKYHPAIVQLLLSKEIGSIAGGGYAEENNFSMDDLSPELAAQIRQVKPYIDDPDNFAKYRDGLQKNYAIKNRGQQFKSTSIDGVNQMIDDMVNKKYQGLEMYDLRNASKDDYEEYTHRHNYAQWKIYSELLNAVYQRAKREHPEQLFQWMDMAIERLVSNLVEKDKELLAEPWTKQFYHTMGSIGALEELAERLAKDQPQIMFYAPSRSKFASWKDYMDNVRAFLDRQGYEMPGYRPTNHQISYEFVRKILEELYKQGGELLDQRDRSDYNAFGRSLER